MIFFRPTLRPFVGGAKIKNQSCFIKDVICLFSSYANKDIACVYQICDKHLFSIQDIFKIFLGKFL